MVIIFEDAEQADLPSLELLGAVTRDLPQVLTIITCNAAALCKASHLKNVFTPRLLKRARRLQLKPFDGDEFVQLVRSYAGFNLDPDKMRMIQQMSGGNPWFVELIGGSELATWENPSDEVHLSPMLRIAANSHLQIFLEHARLPLTIAAMVGSTFELRVLEALCDEPHDQVLDAIWEGQASGVIGPVANRSGSYAFVHNLVREALRADLPKGQAARLHKRIGQVLQELHGFEREYLPEIATHFFHGPPDDGTDPWPGRYCQRAAEYAESSCDFPKAISFYRMALATLHPGVIGVDGWRCDLLLALARAQTRSGNGLQHLTVLLAPRNWRC